jgi:hypothetical protein
MYGPVLCLPSVGQSQGLPIPHKTPKTHNTLDSCHNWFPVEMWSESELDDIIFLDQATFSKALIIQTGDI